MSNLTRLGASLPQFLGLMALTVLVYLPLLPGSFMMDDLRLVQLDNPLVSGKLTVGNIWFQCDFPLSNLVFGIELAWWGQNPFWYHFTNIALHLTGAVLLWRLLIYLRIPGAWLAAALFAAHPVAVGSVARIAELKNTLSLPFFLVSLHCWFRYEDTALYPSSGQSMKMRSVFLYTGCFLAFLIALLSKTSTTMLPLVLLGAAVWRRGRLSWSDAVHTSPLFLLSLAFGALSIWFQKYQALAGETGASLDVLHRLLLAPRTFWFYLEKAFVPVNLCLVYPQWNIDPHQMWSWLPLVAALLLFAGLCFGRNALARNAFYGLLLFAALLFPVMGLFNAQYLTHWQVADHLQYLALIVPVTIAGALVFSARRGLTRQLLAAGLLVAFGALSYQRARAYSSEETLLVDTLEKNPAASEAHNDLGCILAARQQYSPALAHFHASVIADPCNASAHVNLGYLLELKGDADRAENHYIAALDFKPSHPEAHQRYAQMLARRGREKRALLHYRAALAANPSVQTQLEMSALLFQMGDLAGAAQVLNKVLRARPDHPEALNNLAWLLATAAEAPLRNGSRAVQLARHACELTGFQKAQMLGTLAAALAEDGQFTLAVSHARQAVELSQLSGDRHFAELNIRLLQLYKNGKAWHAPSPNSGS